MSLLHAYGRVVIAVGVVMGCQAIPPVQPRFETPSPSPFAPPSPSDSPLTVPFQTPVNSPTAALPTPSPSASGEALPAVDGPPPAANVAAFYYPWYGVERHWHDGVKPGEISSDFWPKLGPYSSLDRAAVAQHMAWLRRAGIGVLVTSWWGRGSYEDSAVPLLLEMAQQYGIKVAFHMEPYDGRSAAGLLADIGYIYDRYGSSPAFFRSPATSRYSAGLGGRGVFFLWLADFQYNNGPRVPANYWRDAVDAAHARPAGALILADAADGTWVTKGHFDGVYNYATLHLDSSGFDWAHTLPPASLYVPSVIPGFSGRRNGSDPGTYQPRDDGATYDAQWRAALDTGVQPALMTITSFNEWHEGTQIEPAAAAATGSGSYDSYAPRASEAYLDQTRSWIDKFETATFAASTTARIEIRTSSDWTNVQLQGVEILQSELISASSQASDASLNWRDGDQFALTQDIDRANAGRQVSMVWNVGISGLVAGRQLHVQVTRGGLGSTTVIIYNMVGANPVQVGQFTWSGTSDELNTRTFALAMSKLLSPGP